MKKNWTKRDPIKNYFPVPNEIFSLGLSSDAISIYGYLLSREDRKTYECLVSYRMISEAIGKSVTTVRKYVMELEERSLIRTERTNVVTKEGRKRNGRLLYHILPIQMAIDQFHERQLYEADLALERQQIQQRMAALEGEECAAVC
ncbi:MAG: helix-turn-helix domain-containing protein [Oscillospiraceae bacterium]|nr:helix-turn-helix domain-containing protein [Oscillospiraceae bacterium]